VWAGSGGFWSGGGWGRLGGEGLRRVSVGGDCVCLEGGKETIPHNRVYPVSASRLLSLRLTFALNSVATLFAPRPSPTFLRTKIDPIAMRRHPKPGCGRFLFFPLPDTHKRRPAGVSPTPHRQSHNHFSPNRPPPPPLQKPPASAPTSNHLPNNSLSFRLDNLSLS